MRTKRARRKPPRGLSKRKGLFMGDLDYHFEYCLKNDLFFIQREEELVFCIELWYNDKIMMTIIYKQRISIPEGVLFLS